MLVQRLLHLLLICLFVIFTVLPSCNEKSSSSSFEIDSKEYAEIKRLVSENYAIYDSKYFTDIENCFFESYLANDFEKEGHRYDRVYEGFLIKYFYCPYNEFRFTIVKGTDNRHYYVGLVDLVFHRKLSDSLYSRRETHLFNDVKIIRDKKGTTSNYINKILFEDPYFTSPIGVSKIEAAYSLVYNCYQKSTSDYHSTYTSIFDEDINVVDVKRVFQESLAETQKDSIEVDNLLQWVYPLTYKYLDRRTMLYKVNNRGIMGFEYALKGEKVEVSQYLFPQRIRRFEFGDDILGFSLPKDCL